MTSTLLEPSASAPQPDYLALAADIISAFVSKNSVPALELPALIGSVHAAIAGLAIPAPSPAEEKLQPPVSIKKSITADYLISLEDGKRYRSLKRHLSGRGLSPDQYREKWGLPRDYPMVAPSYAAARSELARRIGLGRKASLAEPVPAPKARGRRKG